MRTIYSYRANRVLPGSPESVWTAIGACLGAGSAWRFRLVTDEPLRRTIAVTGGEPTDAADIWLSWKLEPSGDGTNVHVVLDETERGPDPDLEELLDLLALYLKAAAEK